MSNATFNIKTNDGVIHGQHPDMEAGNPLCLDRLTPFGVTLVQVPAPVTCQVCYVIQGMISGIIPDHWVQSRPSDTRFGNGLELRGSDL